MEEMKNGEKFDSQIESSKKVPKKMLPDNLRYLLAKTEATFCIMGIEYFKKTYLLNKNSHSEHHLLSYNHLLNNYLLH